MRSTLFRFTSSFFLVFSFKDEYEEQIRCVENAYESLKHSYVQLEVRSMELQSQLSMRQHMNRSSSNSSMLLTSTSLRGSGSGAASHQRRRQSSATTANVDIEVPAAVMTGSGWYIFC